MKVIYRVFVFLLVTASPIVSQATNIQEFWENSEKDGSGIYFKESEGNKYYVNADNLRLISGKLFLYQDNNLIPLKSVSYNLLGTIVTPEAVILLPCPDCGGWYIMGFQHNCNGVLK